MTAVKISGNVASVGPGGTGRTGLEDELAWFGYRRGSRTSPTRRWKGRIREFEKLS